MQLFLARATGGTFVGFSFCQSVSLFVYQFVHFYFSKLTLGHFEIMYGGKILHGSCMSCQKMKATSKIKTTGSHKEKQKKTLDIVQKCDWWWCLPVCPPVNTHTNNAPAKSNYFCKVGTTHSVSRAAHTDMGPSACPSSFCQFQ